MRLQIVIPDEQSTQVERIMKETGMTAKKEFFNHALMLFKWAVEERKAGRVIASVSRDHKHIQVVMMPALDNVREK